MGYLLQAWELSQQKFTMTMKQVVTNAGDGTLENDESINELRKFFSLIDLHTMGRLLEESATGYYLPDSDSFIVSKGSEFSRSETPSCESGTSALRQKLIEEGIVVDYRFVKNIRFSSPSSAAAVVYGGSQNGCIMWTNEDGVTIKELF